VLRRHSGTLKSIRNTLHDKRKATAETHRTSQYHTSDLLRRGGGLAGEGGGQRYWDGKWPVYHPAFSTQQSINASYDSTDQSLANTAVLECHSSSAAIDVAAIARNTEVNQHCMTTEWHTISTCNELSIWSRSRTEHVGDVGDKKQLLLGDERVGVACTICH